MRLKSLAAMLASLVLAVGTVPALAAAKPAATRQTTVVAKHKHKHKQNLKHKRNAKKKHHKQLATKGHKKTTLKSHKHKPVEQATTKAK